MTWQQKITEFFLWASVICVAGNLMEGTEFNAAVALFNACAALLAWSQAA